MDCTSESSPVPLISTSELIPFLGAVSVSFGDFEEPELRLISSFHSISAAASVVCLDLFQRGSSKIILDAERQEVQAALVTLRNMEAGSPIAARGVALIENLLAEESRLVANPSLLASTSQGPPPPKRKRKSEALDHDHDRGSRDFTSFARKMANGAAHEITTSIACPLTLSPPLTFQLPSFDSAAEYSPTSTASDRGAHLFDYDFGAQEEPIPPEFLSVFLGSGEWKTRVRLRARDLSLILRCSLAGFDPLELLSATPGPWPDSI